MFLAVPLAEFATLGMKDGTGDTMPSLSAVELSEKRDRKLELQPGCGR